MQILDDVETHVKRRESTGCNAVYKSVATIKQEISEFVTKRDSYERFIRTRETCRPYGILTRDK